MKFLQRCQVDCSKVLSLRFTISFVCVIALGAAAMWLAFLIGERMTYAYLGKTVSRQLAIHATGLQNKLSGFENVLFALRRDTSLQDLLERPDVEPLRLQVNQKLEGINEDIHATAIYVLNAEGVVVAASNWRNPKRSFVGDRLWFRSYFKNAIDGNPAGSYEVGTTTGEPGYYFAQPVRRKDTGKVVGVIALKINLETLAATTWPSADILLVVDRYGVIVLSSIDGWKYKSVEPLLSNDLKQLTESRKYNGNDIKALGLISGRNLDQARQLVQVSLPGTTSHGPTFVVQRYPLPQTELKLWSLSNVDQVKYLAWGAAVIAGLMVALLYVLVLYWRQRRRAIARQRIAREALERANNELEHRVNERTRDLHLANQGLTREIVERKRAEEELRRTQNDLIHASKLALLGRMSAGLTHEINQPLAALRSLSDNAVILLQRGRNEQVTRNLQMIAGAIERITRITSQLKMFARKTPATAEPVLLAGVVRSALSMLEARICAERVEVHSVVANNLSVLCNDTQLEQVFINLFSNALDAMKGRSSANPAKLFIQAQSKDGEVIMHIADNGPGISETAMPHLFEPFYTTKPQGEGLGLGLVISANFVHAFNGKLTAKNGEHGGAVFEFNLKQI